MPSILIVCTANICRSPVAEALLKQKLQDRGEGWTVSSAGTLGINGWPPAPSSATMMAIRGIDITGYTSTAISVELLNESDLTLCMEDSHVEYLHNFYPPAASRILLLTEMVGEKRNIADPYGGPIQEFEHMVNEVEDILDRGLDRILELATAL